MVTELTHTSEDCLWCFYISSPLVQSQVRPLTLLKFPSVSQTYCLLVIVVDSLIEKNMPTMSIESYKNIPDSTCKGNIIVMYCHMFKENNLNGMIQQKCLSKSSIWYYIYLWLLSCQKLAAHIMSRVNSVQVTRTMLNVNSYKFHRSFRHQPPILSILDSSRSIIRCLTFLLI